MARHVDPDREGLHLQAVRQAFETAAEALAQVDQERWAGWVVYLLEQLQARAESQPDYAVMLASLNDAITRRLDEDMW